MPTSRHRALSAPLIRLLSLLLAALLAATAMTALSLSAATAASAAALPGAITKVATDKTGYDWNERVKLTFAWAVPDTAEAGDTFSLALPAELKAASQARFTLAAPDGQDVATAVWNGREVVFTLTDYVATHDAVSGSGFLTVEWDHAVTPETGGPIVLEFEAGAVQVELAPKPAPAPPCTEDCPAPAPTRTERGVWKGAYWNDGSFEGTRDETSNLSWIVELPGRPTGYVGPITVVDSPLGGTIVECGTFAISTQQTLEGGAVRTPLDPSRYTLECSPAGFQLTVDMIAPAEFIDVRYKGTITDQRSGLYKNKVSVTIPGQSTIDREGWIQRTDAGGIGDGVQSVSVGDYVWLDADRDGIQDADESGIPGVVLVLTGPDGEPVTDVNGVPVGPATTDAAGRYGFDGLPVLSAGQHYTVTIDREASAEALKDLTPTTSGAGDRDVDSSEWTAESADLTVNHAADLTLDFGFVTPQGTLPGSELPETDLPEAQLPEIETPTATTPAAEVELVATESRLASTGTDAVITVWALAIALASMILGAVGVSAARRNESDASR